MAQINVAKLALFDFCWPFEDFSVYRLVVNETWKCIDAYAYNVLKTRIHDFWPDLSQVYSEVNNEFAGIYFGTPRCSAKRATSPH